MKILYLCNYNPWDKISEQKMPSHHLFGIHQLIKKYEHTSNGIRGILKMGGGMWTFIVLSHILIILI